MRGAPHTCILCPIVTLRYAKAMVTVKELSLAKCQLLSGFVNFKAQTSHHMGLAHKMRGCKTAPHYDGTIFIGAVLQSPVVPTPWAQGSLLVALRYPSTTGPLVMLASAQGRGNSATLFFEGMAPQVDSRTWQIHAFTIKLQAYQLLVKVNANAIHVKLLCSLSRNKCASFFLIKLICISLLPLKS